MMKNYYPFGLEHKGYNNVSYGVKNDLKTYQKQEFTEDLGLNTHEWKYRMSDPSIGRIWQVDPLAEEYTYNSTYAFQENKLGSGIELEGLERIKFDEILEEGTRKTSSALGKLGNNFTTGEAKRKMQNAMSNDPLVEVKNEQEKKATTESAIAEFEEGAGPTMKGIAFETAERAEKDVQVVDDILGATALGRFGSKLLPATRGIKILAVATKIGLYASEEDAEGVLIEATDLFVDEATGKVVKESPLPEQAQPATKNIIMRAYDYLFGNDDE